MGKPIKFKIKKPVVRIVNRCILCGKIIPNDKITCNNCALKIKKW